MINSGKLFKKGDILKLELLNKAKNYKIKGKTYEKNTNNFSNKLMYSCARLCKLIRTSYYKKCK